MKVNSHINFLKRRGILIREEKSNYESDFDWVSQHLETIPDEPNIMAIMKAHGADTINGMEEKSYPHYTMTVYENEDGEEYAVGTFGDADDSLHEYYQELINDIGWTDLGLEVSDYILVDDSWIDAFADGEADSYMDSMNEGEIIDASGREDEFEILDDELSELEGIIYELQHEMGGIQGRIDEMSEENEEYEEFGYDEPPHDEEMIQNGYERLRELDDEISDKQGRIDDIPLERDELLDEVTEDVREEHAEEIRDCMEDPIDCLVHQRGWFSDAEEAVESLGLEVDTEAMAGDLANDADYGELSHYDGEYVEEEVGDTWYIILRLD